MNFLKRVATISALAGSIAFSVNLGFGLSNGLDDNRHSVIDSLEFAVGEHDNAGHKMPVINYTVLYKPAVGFEAYMPQQRLEFGHPLNLKVDSKTGYLQIEINGQSYPVLNVKFSTTPLSWQPNFAILSGQQTEHQSGYYWQKIPFHSMWLHGKDLESTTQDNTKQLSYFVISSADGNRQLFRVKYGYDSSTFDIVEHVHGNHYLRILPNENKAVIIFGQ
ncbi:hypothetical protein [Cysteiniphilum sp. QT6929]|uniref:hypothetical protein n=1 Tax=Cysteiniphilum sp. QT6929 TaxID=2975055 RepID=UPI0024B389EF|nr:hypothetical protein [Cysteiniphilum sp. QT6929]WHN65122.1 hypothetical protein NYP54_08730 [Cysteiniphilum sp. QT6929]